ncbi:MAG: 2-C-methyl-D-erythritol 4-phosphate cytidylyltransferase [Muribaculaceae bacterium]
MNRYAIIVAGGKGSRMTSALPKQFIELCGRPVLMHTIDAFRSAFDDISIVLVLAEQEVERWNNLCRCHSFVSPDAIAYAGATRFHSVFNGLNLISSDTDGFVAVHDGVRPLVSADMIRRSFEEAESHGAAVPVIPVVDSVRRVLTDGDSISLTRSELRAVQTPQTFSLPLLRQAYLQPFSEHFTDDASVVEACGAKVALYAGEISNIKITHPIDLLIAQYYIDNK